MSHGFEHHAEAQHYAIGVTNPRARVALGIVHHLILEAGGMHLHLLPERYSPIQTVDVLLFYKAVERLFTEWNGEARNYPEIPGNRERLYQFQQATALIPTLPAESGRIGLRNFLSILLNTPVTEETSVDTLFCSRLVAILFSHSELLERILSGDDSWETIDAWAGILD